MRSIFLATVVFFAAGVGGFAIPTGLNSMPTAEVLGMGYSRIEYGFSGSGLLYADYDTDSVLGSQTGFILGIEGGVDRVSEKGTVYNAKLLLFGEGLVMPATAVGIQNIISDERPQYYVVCTKSLLPMGMMRVSAGGMYDENMDTLGMVGAGLYTDKFVAKADYITGGDKDRSSIGAGFKFSGLTVYAAHFDYRDGERDDETTVTISYINRGVL